MKFIEEFGRCAEEDAVAVVNSGSDEGVDQSFGSRKVYVLLKREIVVKNDSEVVTVWVHECKRVV